MNLYVCIYIIFLLFFATLLKYIFTYFAINYDDSDYDHDMSMVVTMTMMIIAFIIMIMIR